MGVAIVTGASSGIGRAIYRHFHHFYELRDFSHVIGVSRHGPDVCADLMDIKDAVNAVIAAIDKQSIRCLVNCAGIMHLGVDDELNAHEIFQVNFWAPYYLLHELRPSLEGGVVINIASVGGMIAEEDAPVYGASKAALLSLTKSLAVQWAPHVRVNAISPGFVRDTGLLPDPAPEELIDRVPLRHEATVDMLLPVVDAILDSPFVTGANFVVDGGQSCRAG